MFTFIKQKLLYKKWLNICLLTGIVLLIAVAACLPMYQNMSENQALQNQMKEYVQENGKYPHDQACPVNHISNCSNSRNYFMETL